MTVYDIWLCQVPGMGSREMIRLWESFSRDLNFAHAIYDMSSEVRKKYFLSSLESQMKKESVLLLIDQTNLARKSLDPYLCRENLVKKGLRFVTLQDKEYPEALRRLYDPPYGLYVRGRMPLSDRPVVVIAGTKYPSSYGCNQAKWFSDILSNNGVQVITGMSEGVEAVATDAALNAQTLSFAVFGSGADVCPFEKGESLYRRLCEQGGVISEYPPGTRNSRERLIERNRIIGGLADIVLVIEAKIEYVQTIAVDTALEYGTDVFAVPGRNDAKGSRGCNYLIRQGAGIATSPYDLLEYFYGSRDVCKKKNRPVPLDKQYDLEVFANINPVMKYAKTSGIFRME